jgi:hypothetical protein
MKVWEKEQQELKAAQAAHQMNVADVCAKTYADNSLGGDALQAGLGQYTPRPTTPVERFQRERQHTLDRAKRLDRAAEILAKHPEFEELLELINLNVI